MISKESLAMKPFVTENRWLFEKVAREYVKDTRFRERKYSQLNYKRILDEMVDFVNGYIEYKSKNSNKYAGKVLGTAKSFYDGMFEKANKKKYRKILYLPDVRDSYTEFLEGTKALQILLENSIDRAKLDPEFDMLLTMTNNQYRKISKVCKDDMEIYLWQATLGKSYEHTIPSKLRVDFVDDNTPVLHYSKIKSDDLQRYGEEVPDDE